MKFKSGDLITPKGKIRYGGKYGIIVKVDPSHGHSDLKFPYKIYWFDRKEVGWYGRVYYEKMYEVH